MALSSWSFHSLSLTHTPLSISFLNASNFNCARSTSRNINLCNYNNDINRRSNTCMYHCKQHCTLLIYLYIYISHSKTHQLDSTKSTHQQINTSPLLRIASNTPLSTQHQSHSVWGGVCGVCVENSQCSSKTPHSQNTPTRHHQIDTSTDKHLASFEDRI